MLHSSILRSAFHDHLLAIVRVEFVMITQMQVKGLMFDPYNNAYIVVLRDEDAGRHAADLGRKVRSERDQPGTGEGDAATPDDARFHEVAS